MIIRPFGGFQTAPTHSATRLTRVLHVINGEHYSGAERVQDLLGLRLPEWGYDAGFVCLKPGMFETQRRCQGCDVFILQMRSRIDFGIVRQVVEIYREGGYGLLHAHTPRSLLIAGLAARQLGCPLVYHVHSPVGRDSKRWWANRLNAIVERLCLRRVSRMICVSKALKEYMIRQGHSSRKLAVVHNGVPIDPTPRCVRETGALRLGVVALFRPRKGLEVLLEALSVLKRRNGDVRLIAIGSFETETYRREIMKLAERQGVASQIEWTGFCSDVTGQLHQLDALVLPSLFGEGLPMVVLEAMASGLPVIASDVEGLSEAVEHNVSGLLFPAGDSTALADSIERLQAAPEWVAELGDAARAQQRAHLSDRSMARQISKIYSELMP